MELFLDTASANKVERWSSLGLVAGVTTNAALLSDVEGNAADAIRHIAALVNGPVSVPVLSNSPDTMVEQALTFFKLADNIVIKIPATQAGFSAAHSLKGSGVKINVTFAFEPSSVIPFLPLSPEYVSLILDREADLTDSPHDVESRIRLLHDVIASFGAPTQIIAASIRHPGTLSRAIAAGVDIVTVPPKTWELVLANPLTAFEADSIIRKSHASIICRPETPHAER